MTETFQKIHARPDPVQTIQRCIEARYLGAKSVFWAGSISKGGGTVLSDLDLVIVYGNLPNAYREAFVYDDWPIDAFVHDIDTLRYFLEESRTVSGISGTICMILEGQEMTPSSPFSEKIQILAKEIFAKGPTVWDSKQIDKERFLITDVLDDIRCPASREEQIASATWLYDALSQFYFRSQNKWRASGKSIVRYLKNEDPAFASEFTQCFEKLFQTGNAMDLELLVQKILAPYGGVFWDGFRSDAPGESKLSS